MLLLFLILAAWLIILHFDKPPQRMDRHPYFFSTGDGQKTPAWWIRKILKPNMTLNAIVNIYVVKVRLSKIY